MAAADGRSYTDFCFFCHMLTDTDNDINNDSELEWGLPETLPEKIDLPFERSRKTETGEWIYDHRVTICITVIVYLAIAVVLLSAKIMLRSHDKESVVIVDFSDPSELDRLQEELRRAEELNKMLNNADSYETAHVRNEISNEHADEVRDKLSSETREIFDRSQEVMRDMDRNSAEYEQMLADLDVTHKQSGPEAQFNDHKVKGRVTVSFSLSQPLRHAVRLPVPAYKCSGGGTVVIDIVVNRNGDVLSASVDRSRSSSDNCMNSAALEMAQRSRFNVDSSAPGRHSGTITYVFLPQQ